MEISLSLRYYAASSEPIAPLVDIGANLLDPMFQGVYRDKVRHQADLAAVLDRARDAGLERIIVTVGQLAEARRVGELASISANPQLGCTLGVHPTNCAGLEERDVLELLRLAEELPPQLPWVAVGELGLDYERFEFCGRDEQLRGLELQLRLLGTMRPLFLHCRGSEAAKDLLAVLRRHDLHKPPGVVHSFDGSLDAALDFIDLGFCIGLNGCSLRTTENLEVVRQLPLDSILLETDAPWCGIKATHAGHHFVSSKWEEVKKPEKWEEGKCVKDRCEPCHLRSVLEVVAGCRGVQPEMLAAAVHTTVNQVFPGLG